MKPDLNDAQSCVRRHAVKIEFEISSGVGQAPYIDRPGSNLHHSCIPWLQVHHCGLARCFSLPVPPSPAQLQIADALRFAQTRCVALRCLTVPHGAARRLASSKGMIRYTAAYCGTLRRAAPHRIRCEEIFRVYSHKRRHRNYTTE